MKINLEKQIISFEWRVYDQYILLYSDSTVEIKDLENNDMIKQYKVD